VDFTSLFQLTEKLSQVCSVTGPCAGSCPALSTSRSGMLSPSDRATTAESVMSPWTISIAPFTSRFTFSSLSALRETTRTWAPCAASASTVARPTPLAPPVTTA
jgi:hypothetical protein